MKDLFDLFDINDEKDLVATDPHTLENLDETEEGQDFVVDKVRDFETTTLKVDYTDFSNFVFFNSAEDYFNITGEKILNEFPAGGSVDDIQKFTLSLDGYQQHVLSSWPNKTGHLRFVRGSASYITIDDVGDDMGKYRSGILSPGSGSFSIELWYNSFGALTGSDDIQILYQKVSGSNEDGCTLYLSGSHILFAVKSGSSEASVESSASFGIDGYVCAVMDRTSFTGSLLMLTGSANKFPIIASTASLNIFGPINVGGVKAHIGSGSLSGKVTVSYSGSLDEVKLWTDKRLVADVTSSFNVKQHAQKKLVGLYRFNETDTFSSVAENSIVIDYSGKKLNGRISNYYDTIRGSGSLIDESSDPVLSVGASVVSDFITLNQVSGSDFDRQNKNNIINLVPEKFLQMEDDIGTTLLRDFLYVYARHFDEIKLRADHVVNVLKTNYGKYNQTPDELLDVTAKFFGWDFAGNFLNANAFQYVTGKNIHQNTASNSKLDTKLYEIKNKFWRRTLINLMHIYKAKGTKDSIKALLSVYGVDDHFVKIKEFGHARDVGISTNRIKSEKSVSTLGFGSGSLTGSILASLQGNNIPTSSFSIESRIKFPTTGSIDIQATKLSGSIWSLISGSSFTTLRFERDSLASFTGSLFLTSSDFLNKVELTGAGIFNNEWNNISVVIDEVSSSLKIDVRRSEDKDITFSMNSSSSLVTGITRNTPWTTFVFGATSSFDAEYWAQEVRLWNSSLSNRELNDHTLNFQSYGVEDARTETSDIILHWRLQENVTASIDGDILPRIEDCSVNVLHGIGTGFDPSELPYKKFLNEYAYIASPDLGWSEDKIRVFNTSKLNKSQTVRDAKTVSLEFNMIDSLNEDIVQMQESLDSLNEYIGLPANKYRAEYHDLFVMRETYFKRLQGRLNFRVFADMLDFFDRSFIDMVRKLIPARADFIGDEFVVESHMLERPKISYERRKQQETIFEPLGIIEVWSRFGVNDDRSGRTFPIYLTGSL